MRTFEHHQARSIPEAIQYMERYGGRARLNAGGTDLLGVLKGDLFSEYPEAIINLKTIPNLQYIREKHQTLEIGALTKLVDIIESPLIRERYPVLSEAARSIGSPQIRNIATLGGNLCQEVRCWYYRYPRNIGGPILCLRKGRGSCPALKGDHRFHAIMGAKKCFAVCPSDMATALAVLDAKLLIAGPEGTREVLVTDFYHPLGHGLKKSEVLKEIRVPSLKAPAYQRFIKFTLREPIDFAVVSVAIHVVLTAGKCEKARISLGAVAPSPVRAYEAEKIIMGKTIVEDLAQEAAEMALKRAKPLSQNGYKVEIAKTLIKRAIFGSVN